ncbi:type I-E CRISPR-associated protein Cas5/CasD [Nodosilinea sp. LEGE 07088]|uniref:type I-E CRISPR-associated protein Cas5/CasD n=1 Tax=Nodosilinea sp. LEGE 07088 TaxID=2777968 RepID=UPI00187F9197|nr:type I-E CRISPR-associated protein Cas5/CasD [Nodosilinea sp. LEGE 07088]MBE9140791.1 type I-E CRISPR-associated protein Cas5/CasD [Nodosilinea sp. LEGE 07088]
MPTLLMRMRAPMMSWGDHSRFTIRDTRREPTKSAVIGLLCAALGRPRWEPVTDLTALKMGVRINKPGVVQCDYHTVMDGIKSGGGPGGTVISHRYYVADADYLVGLEGSRSKLAELDAALQTPCWHLYFGRKSFVPSCPIHISEGGLVEANVEDALKQHPYVPPKRGKPPQQLAYILETPNSSDVRQDVPIDWQRRLFTSRCVETKFHDLEVPSHVSF